MTPLPFDSIKAHCDRMKIPVSLAQNNGRDFPLVYVNAAFEQLTEYQSADVVGKSCRLLQGAATDRTVCRHIRGHLEAGEYVCSIITNYRKSGGQFQNFLIIQAMQSSDRGPLFIGFQHELSAYTQKADLTEHISRVWNVERAVGAHNDMAHDQLLTALSQRSETALLALKMLQTKGALRG